MVKILTQPITIADFTHAKKITVTTRHHSSISDTTRVITNEYRIKRVKVPNEPEWHLNLETKLSYIYKDDMGRIIKRGASKWRKNTSRIHTIESILSDMNSKIKLYNKLKNNPYADVVKLYE